MQSPASIPDMHVCHLVQRHTKCLAKRVLYRILLLLCLVNMTKYMEANISVCMWLFSITCYVYLVHKRLYMVVYVVYMSRRWFLIAMISTVSLSFGVCWVQYVATLSQHKAIGVFGFS